jgi:hypothetical protein
MIQKSWALLGLPALIMCLSTGRAAVGQDAPDPLIAGLDGRVSVFLEKVSLGDTQAAYQELLAGSPLVKQTEAIEALVKRTDELKERFGQYREFEQIAARRVGKDLVLMKYLYKCEDFPVVFYFTFYRTPGRGELPPERNDWRVIIVRFDTELELLAL